MPCIIAAKTQRAARCEPICTLQRLPLCDYFRLMVVFTPWLVVLSSNQRAVIVLVWV